MNHTKNYNDTNIQKIFEDIKSNTDFFKKYYIKDIKIIDEKLIEPKELILEKENNIKIKYYDEFTIINSELKESLIINKVQNQKLECEIIINMGNILILFDFSNLKQILIGSLYILPKDELNILPLQLIYFEDCNEKKSYFEFFKQNKFQINKQELI